MKYRLHRHGSPERRKGLGPLHPYTLFTQMRQREVDVVRNWKESDAA